MSEQGMFCGIHMEDFEEGGVCHSCESEWYRLSDSEQLAHAIKEGFVPLGPPEGAGVGNE